MPAALVRYVRCRSVESKAILCAVFTSNSLFAAISTALPSVGRQPEHSNISVHGWQPRRSPVAERGDGKSHKLMREGTACFSWRGNRASSFLSVSVTVISHEDFAVLPIGFDVTA